MKCEKCGSGNTELVQREVREICGFEFGLLKGLDRHTLVIEVYNCLDCNECFSIDNL